MFTGVTRSQRPPPGGELAGPVRRRQHCHAMTALAQLAREPGDVLVHVVRLRPREGRDEGDAI